MTADPRFTRAVGRRGVDEIDAEIQHLVEQTTAVILVGECVGMLVLGTLVPADLEGPESDGTGRQTGSAETTS